MHKNSTKKQNHKGSLIKAAVLKPAKFYVVCIIFVYVDFLHVIVTYKKENEFCLCGYD